MREIKFRAWHNEEERYEYLSKSYYMGGQVGLMDITIGSDKAIWEQFTGLHDKNGKEIYEGDIVSVDSSVGKLCGTVVYEKYYFTVRGFYNSTFDYPDMAFSEGDYEVIGNIHENKKLIDAKV